MTVPEFRPALVAACAMLWLSMAAPAPAALSGFSSTYDNARQVRLSGPVTRIDWNNPHAFVFIDVRDGSGTVTNWAVEIGNPLDLDQAGWKRSAVHIGDIVKVEGLPARGQKRQAFAKSVVLARTGAKIFVESNRKPAAPKAEPAPRWPDGQVRLGPAPGKKGYWGRASSPSLVENKG
ncbi:MAG TPA: DUF6152 family protein, partial [Bryobacteraceae bacterium]|nr:DUF6152 family protein [Bryobacteraceae bacterium]